MDLPGAHRRNTFVIRRIALFSQLFIEPGKDQEFAGCFYLRVAPRIRSSKVVPDLGIPTMKIGELSGSPAPPIDANNSGLNVRMVWSRFLRCPSASNGCDCDLSFLPAEMKRNASAKSRARSAISPRAILSRSSFTCADGGVRQHAFHRLDVAFGYRRREIICEPPPGRAAVSDLARLRVGKQPANSSLRPSIRKC